MRFCRKYVRSLRTNAEWKSHIINDRRLPYLTRAKTKRPRDCSDLTSTVGRPPTFPNRLNYRLPSLEPETCLTPIAIPLVPVEVPLADSLLSDRKLSGIESIAIILRRHLANERDVIVAPSSEQTFVRINPDRYRLVLRLMYLAPSFLRR